MVVFAFIVALFHHHQSAGVIFHTSGTSLTGGTFLVAMFMALYVIYGFDTASTLSEETKSPRTEAPKAVIASVIGAFVIGAIFLYAMLLGIPNMATAIKEGWGPAQIIDANFGNAFSTVFLLVVSAAIFVCCLAIETSTIRLCFGMSRDDALPASKHLRKVNPKLHTPVLSCIVVALLSAIPFIQYAGVAIIAIAATGMIYLSYLIGNVALFRARLRGWPKTKAPFSLGKWGLPLTVLALLYGGGMFLNMLWPRAATNPRPATEAPALNFHWHWLNSQPVLWSTLGVIVIVGALYFVLVQRNKPAHLEAPEGEERPPRDRRQHAVPRVSREADNEPHREVFERRDRRTPAAPAHECRHCRRQHHRRRHRGPHADERRERHRACHAYGMAGLQSPRPLGVRSSMSQSGHMKSTWRASWPSSRGASNSSLDQKWRMRPSRLVNTVRIGHWFPASSSAP